MKPHLPLALAFLFITHCASQQNATNTVNKAEELREYFLDEDTLIGSGTSAPSVKTPNQKEATAKMAARVDATGRIIVLELRPKIQAAKMVKASCSSEQTETKCRIWLRVTKKGLKKDCELARAEIADWQNPKPNPCLHGQSTHNCSPECETSDGRAF